MTANDWSKPTAVEYNGLRLTKAIKMETTTSIKFTAPAAGQLEVVSYATKGEPYIKVNGKKYPVSKSGGVRIDVPKGACEITKDTSSTYLYYLAFSYETGGGTEEPTFVYGDVTADGILAADDALCIMQAVIVDSYKMPVLQKGN